MFTPDLIIKNNNSDSWFRGSIHSVVPNRRAVTYEAYLEFGVIRRISKLLLFFYIYFVNCKRKRYYFLPALKTFQRQKCHYSGKNKRIQL